MGKVQQLVQEDWEHTLQKDYIFLLEYQKEMEEAWLSYERKPAIIKFNNKNATKYRNSTFYRTYKKIMLSRSNLCSKTIGPEL